MVGEVGAEMEGVQGEEEGGDEEEDGLEDPEDTGRDGVRVVHLLGGLNAGWWHQFQSITEVLLGERYVGDRLRAGLRPGLRQDKAGGGLTQ
jgi:hypothetical protein